MIRAIDLFCGAGGSSWGARNAGATIVAGVDASAVATAAYKRNFPRATVHTARLEDIEPESLVARRWGIDLLLASPECTSHSPAKGGSPRCERSKSTAFEVVRFAAALKPRWLIIENVASMRRWNRYEEFLYRLRTLGYRLDTNILNAADFGVPQTRRRLFIVGDLERQPLFPRKHIASSKPVRSVVSLGDDFSWRPLFGAGRAKGTILRARRALRAIGRSRPFLLVYYGSDGAGGWQPLDRPLRTLTTLDRFAIVKPTRRSHVMRMLQVPELKRAMGMPQSFVAGLGSRRDQIRAIGNAVCPPVMRLVASRLFGR